MHHSPPHHPWQAAESVVYVVAINLAADSMAKEAERQRGGGGMGGARSASLEGTLHDLGQQCSCFLADLHRGVPLALLLPGASLVDVDVHVLLHNYSNSAQCVGGMAWMTPNPGPLTLYLNSEPWTLNL